MEFSRIFIRRGFRGFSYDGVFADFIRWIFERVYLDAYGAGMAVVLRLFSIGGNVHPWKQFLSRL
jgi:hypothetical protein